MTGDFMGILLIFRAKPCDGIAISLEPDLCSLGI